MEHDCKNIERLGKAECNIDKLYTRTDIHSIDIAQIKIQMAGAIALCERVLLSIDKLTENMNKHTTESVEYRAKIDSTAKRVDEDERLMEKKFNDLVADIDKKDKKNFDTTKFVLWIFFGLVSSVSISWVVFKFFVNSIINAKHAGLY